MLTLHALLDRLAQGQIKEVILGTNPTMEGDTTALHLQNQIREKFPDVSVTRLARGLATGSSIEYANKNMLAEALAAPARSLWLEQRSLILDHRNVLRSRPDSVARELHFGELHDGRGTRTVALLLGIDPSLLPRTDFFKAAKRYTG